MLDETTRQRDFPTLCRMTYLNTAAEGISPVAVGEALQSYFQDHVLGMDGRILHAKQWEAVRALAGQLFGLSREEVAFCLSSSDAYNLAAYALRLQPGEEVVINDLDFPSGRTPFQQPTCPAEVKVWRARQGALRVEDLAPLLSSRTRLVSFSLVSFYNGFKVSLPAVVEMVQRHSPALLAVDVTQALGRIPLDLRGADLIISSTYKWILGSHGGALVGVPKAGADALTTHAGGWFNLNDPFGQSRFAQVECLPGAASFMAGMPNYPAVYAVRAALDYIIGIGVANIAQVAQPLVRQCLDGLKRLPVEILTPDDDESLAGIVSFLHPADEEIERRLRAEDIHVMRHAGRIRISIHGYNTSEDVERLLRALHGILIEG